MKNLTAFTIILAGVGCSEPSDRYKGISEPREITAERSPATRPSLPSDSPARANHPGPAVDDSDSPGTADPVGPNTALATDGATRVSEPSAARKGRELTAQFQTAPGVELTGTAHLREVEGGVHVSIEVAGAKMGARGVHVHERADCSDLAGMSMGGHFAPRGHRHGLPGFAEHHLGDLGNVNIGKHGGGELEITVARATLAPGGPMSFAHRAIVIHAERDVGRREQPSGGSGQPLACAVIPKT